MTKPNAIEEIMASEYYDCVGGNTLPETAAQRILAALDAAGLAVVPKEAEEYQLIDCPADIDFSDLEMVYRLGVAGFEPTTWKPKA